MKKLWIIIVTTIFYINLSAQNKFNNCSAIFLDKKLVVNEYSPEGKCMLNASAAGKLTVNTATYENDKWHMGDKISFKITIRDGKTKTLWSFSDKTYVEMDIKKVLEKCQKGDYILISILKDEYALPHNEILIE